LTLLHQTLPIEKKNVMEPDDAGEGKSKCCASVSAVKGEEKLHLSLGPTVLGVLENQARISFYL
jgi:hypothetical protein